MWESVLSISTFTMPPAIARSSNTDVGWLIKGLLLPLPASRLLFPWDRCHPRLNLSQQKYSIQFGEPGFKKPKDFIESGKCIPSPIVTTCCDCFERSRRGCKRNCLFYCEAPRNCQCKSAVESVATPIGVEDIDLESGEVSYSGVAL